MNNQQKKTEGFYLEHFLKLMDYRPQQITPAEPPDPDFIIVLNRNKIGVEMTGHHSNTKGPTGHPRRAVEETWKKLQKDLMIEAAKYPELKGAIGSLSFKELDMPPRSKHSVFIREIVQISRENIPPARKEIEIYKFNKGFLIGKYLRKIKLLNLNLDRHMVFDWLDLSWVGISDEELLRSINPKINKDYRQSDFAEIWLLIVGGTQYLSQSMGMLSVEKLNSYSRCNKILLESQFDRTFLFNYFFDQVFEWSKKSPFWIESVKSKY